MHALGLATNASTYLPMLLTVAARAEKSSEVARLAIVPDGGHVACDRAPAPTLPRIIGAAPALVIAAVLLEPPAGTLPVNPPLTAPDGERL